MLSVTQTRFDNTTKTVNIFWTINMCWKHNSQVQLSEWWNRDKGRLYVSGKIQATTFVSKALKWRWSVFEMKSGHSHFFFKEAINKVQLDNFKTDWTAGEILVNLKRVHDIITQLSGRWTKAQSPNKSKWKNGWKSFLQL